MQKKNDPAAWIWANTKKSHARLLIITIGHVIYSLCSVSSALVSKSIIDNAVNKDFPLVLKFCLMLLVLIALQLLLNMWLSWLRERVRSKTAIILRKRLLEALMKKDYSEVSSKHSGDWMSRIFSDVNIVADGSATIIPELSSLLTQMVGALAALTILSPLFSLILVVAGAVLISISFILRKRMKKLHKQVQEKYGHVHSFFQETIENLLVIRIFSAEKNRLEEEEKKQDELYRAEMRRKNFSIVANASISAIFKFSFLFSLGWGAFGIYSGSMTFGTLAAILQLVSQIETPVAYISSSISRVFTITASAERLMEAESFRDEEKSGEEDLSFEAMDFRNVSFSYGRQDVITNATFSIKKGDIAAITGISGGGKSTLFLLMLGIYEANQGDMAIYTDKGKRAPSKSTRKLFAYVPQGNGLFSGTIRENLLLSSPNADEKKIHQALTLAAADFVFLLPDGPDTVIGERGAGLSEGQKQRIAIARALLSGADVILLDEATSALDEETEKTILENISALEEKTCLIVTHRKAALGICNKHLVLCDCTITEDAIS